MIENLPWFMYPVVLGIVFSGYMVLYWNKKEHDLEQNIIEKEGEVYMTRIHEEKKRRQDIYS